MFARAWRKNPDRGKHRMMTVIATIRAQPGHEQTLGALLATLAAASRGERGCAGYRVFRSTQDGTLFTTFEQWEDASAETRHMACAHVAEAFAQAGPLLAAPPDIRRFEELR